MSGEPVTVRLRLDLCYDGTDFHGWAVQPGRRTVAGVLGEALSTLFRAPVPMVVAGRTDAGVHASGQVAHIDVDPAALAGLAPRLPGGPVTGPAAPAPSGGPFSAGSDAGPVPGLIGLRRRLAGLLPPDVRVRGARIAPDGFDARFSALRRHYRYRISDTEWGAEPLRRWDTLVWRRRLDPGAMQRAANLLAGLHDFAAYCKPREGATTVRELQRLTVSAWPYPRGGPPSKGFGVQATVGALARTQEPLLGRSDSPDEGAEWGSGGTGEGALVEIDVTADAFCHSMVRSLVGALLAVGDGRTPVARPAELLAAGRRTAEIAVAPAHGLTLVGVDYPPDGELADRAARTRAVRDRPG